MGYGSRALKALNSFYSGEYFNLDEATHAEPSYPDATAVDPVSVSFAGGIICNNTSEGNGSTNGSPHNTVTRGDATTSPAPIRKET